MLLLLLWGRKPDPNCRASNLLVPHRAKTLPLTSFHFLWAASHPPARGQQATGPAGLFTNMLLHSAFSGRPLALPSGVLSRRKGGCRCQHHRNIPPREPRSPSMLVATTQLSPLLLLAIAPRMRGPTCPQEGTRHPAVVPTAPRGHKDTCSHPYLLPFFLCSAQARESHSPTAPSISICSDQPLPTGLGTAFSQHRGLTLPAVHPPRTSCPSSISSLLHPGKEKSTKSPLEQPRLLILTWVA